MRIILTALPQFYLLMILSRLRVIPSKTVKYKTYFERFFYNISRYNHLRSKNMFVWFMIFYNRRGRNVFHLRLLILSNKENIGQKLNRNIKYERLICWWIINIAYWWNTTYTRVKLIFCYQVKKIFWYCYCARCFSICKLMFPIQFISYIAGVSWCADKIFHAENVKARKARLPLKLSVFILIKVSISIQQSLWLQTFLDSCFPCLGVSLRSCFDPVNILRPFRL